tara:strand:+ start:176 stop:1471 length:1296 start_codon:yes stop_codon:yes gene_type:complete
MANNFWRPTSLLARTNFTLTVSSLLIVAVSVFALNHYVIEPIAEKSADDQAALLVLSAQTWVELPPDARPYFELELAQNHDLIVNSQVQLLPLSDLDQSYLGLLSQKLETRLGATVEVLEGDDLIWANVPMAGQQIQIGFEPSQRDIQPLYVGVIIIGLGAGIVFITSLFLVQRVTRPLDEVAGMAGTFRGNDNFEPVPETGPKELVSLAKNFNTMAKEIAVLLSNRTTLLAGISHDLRTPLTRMRLALELLPTNVDRKVVDRIERNLLAMDQLIGDALQFARGAREPTQELELRPFLEDILGSFDIDIPLVCSASESRFQIAPRAFHRVLSNLISNAQQHGNHVQIFLDNSNIRILDDGPGIAEEYREKVFQPFFRLDTSRSRATGGSGLGLAIVQQLCQAHGWRVTIDGGQNGGTEVVVELDPQDFDTN